ncbi:hypothetical protein MBLNU13_g05354t1 [Cladosporium sp. NU13]
MGPTAINPTATSGYNGTVSSAVPYPTSTTSLSACAKVAQLAIADPAATPIVPAALAYECITSVPFNSSAASELLTSIRPYLNWQSTVDYIRDPPAEYAEKIQEPYDFYGEFNRIAEKAESNGYGNEYEFGFDLYEAFQRTHDGHFVYYPDSVTGVFSWGRTTPLVSVSDGDSVPEIYAYADVLTASFGNATFVPSPLVEIDGQNATDFLLNWSQYGSLQDRDALWNNLFYTLAQVALGSSGTGTGTFSGGGRGARIYPGETTTLTFANGTTVVNENFARVLAPFDNITSGEDIYREFFTIPEGEPQSAEEIATSTTSSSTEAPTSSETASTTTTPVPAPGYPTPFVNGDFNANSGYFLSGDEYDDVAVLAVRSFVGGAGSQENFQAVNTYLIDQAVAQNKTKLIIDVSANGGGTILQGYDLFTQLFPQILPYGANRFRAHEAFDLIGEEVSKYSGAFDRDPSLNQSVKDILSTTFNYRTDATVDYEPFTSWDEKFGPHAYGPGPDNYTSLIRWNLSDPLITENSGGIYVSGYQNRSNITAQPFKAENIVVVYDGYCASTCTIFSEFMRQQAGVQTIALGGRPTKDIIQAVGGVKGTNSFPWSYILGSVEIPFQTELLHDADYYANETALGNYSDLPLLRATNYVVNARDGIREGDKDETPLHFVYEAADCRIYYTPAMVVDQEAVWKTVADTAFKGQSSCVAGEISSGGNGTYTKRAVKKHGIRRDIDLKQHAVAIGNVWTDKDGITHGGDGYMYP